MILLEKILNAEIGWSKLAVAVKIETMSHINGQREIRRRRRFDRIPRSSINQIPYSISKSHESIIPLCKAHHDLIHHTGTNYVNKQYQMHKRIAVRQAS